MAITAAAGGDRSGGGAGLRALGGGACLISEAGAVCGKNSGEVADSPEAGWDGTTGSGEVKARSEERRTLEAGTVAENSRF